MTPERLEELEAQFRQEAATAAIADKYGVLPHISQHIAKRYTEAADAIKSLRERVRELEADNAGLHNAIDAEAQVRIEMTEAAERERIRAEAAESRLAEADKVLEPFHQFIDEVEWSVETTGRMPEPLPMHVYRAARSFREKSK